MEVEEIKRAIQTLPKNELEKIRLAIYEVHKEKYRSHKKYYEGVKRCFEPEELKAFFQNVRNWKAYLIFRLMAETGMRPCETLSLLPNAINFEKKEVYVHAAKGSKDRTAKISDKLLEALNIYMQINFFHIKERGYVFFARNVKSNKKPFISEGWLVREFRRTCERAGLTKYYAPREGDGGKLHNLNCKSFRHTFFTRGAIDLNIPVPVLWKIGGHRNLESTQTYISNNIRQELIENAKNKIKEIGID